MPAGARTSLWLTSRLLVSLFVVFVPPAVATEPDAFALNWHQWRGPTANGCAAPGARPPVQLQGAEKAKWTVELPGEGASTPIVWDNQVFVLSAERTDRPAETPVVVHPDAKTQPPNVYYRFLVTSVDRQDGRVLWQKVATEQVPHEGKHTTHTYAAASPTTDGERLYVSFSSRGLYCFSLTGDLLWQRDLGDMRTRFAWGEAVTPALAGNLLIVNWDAEEGSFITALDKFTGEEVWRKDRPGELTSWNTPLITEVSGRWQAIVNGSGMVRAYDVQTGDVIWECGGQTTNAIPTALRVDDTIVCMSGYRSAASFGIPVDAAGNITGSAAIRWSYPQGTPYVPSPSASGERLYFTAQTTDILTVLNAKTGQPLQDRLRLNGLGNCYASPLVAHGHVYFVGREGGVVVIRDEAPFATVSSTRLDGNFDASPVAVGNQLFLRSWNRLYCFEE